MTHSSAEDNFEDVQPQDCVMSKGCAAQIVRVDKHYDVPQAVPDININYHRNLMEKEWRSGLKPLHIVQPEGPSFNVEGNLIKWQKWHIRISFNSREGLVLHNVGCVLSLLHW